MIETSIKWEGLNYYKKKMEASFYLDDNNLESVSVLWNLPDSPAIVTITELMASVNDYE